MSKILIKGGRIIDPYTKTDEYRDLYIENGFIKNRPNTLEGIKVIDATGKWIVPGLTDMHTHFRDPGFTHKEDIFTGLRAAARGGFTAVVTMANTNPVTDNPETIKHQIRHAQNTNLSRLLPVSSITQGMQGEKLVNMSGNIAAGAIAFSEDGKSVENEKVFFDHLINAKNHGVVTLTHCDDVKGEEYYAERDIWLAEKADAKLHIQHLSTADTVEIIRQAKKRTNLITAEATPHHFSLTEADYKIHGVNAKMAPPLRTEKDRLAIIKGLKDGTIDVIATDHAPHTAEEKSSQTPPNGIIGLETAVGLAVRTLFHDYDIYNGKELLLDAPTLISKFTTNPNKILGLGCVGLVEGSPANITIIDPLKKWEVDSTKFASKSKNQPYDGMILTGKTTQTIFNGNIIHDEDLSK